MRLALDDLDCSNLTEDDIFYSFSGFLQKCSILFITNFCLKLLTSLVLLVKSVYVQMQKSLKKTLHLALLLTFILGSLKAYFLFFIQNRGVTGLSIAGGRVSNEQMTLRYISKHDLLPVKACPDARISNAPEKRLGILILKKSELQIVWRFWPYYCLRPTKSECLASMGSIHYSWRLLLICILVFGKRTYTALRRMC